MASHSRFGFQRRVGDENWSAASLQPRQRKRDGKQGRERGATMAISKEECGNAFAQSYRFDASHPNRARRNAVAARNSGNKPSAIFQLP